MTIAESILPELDREMTTTRTLLERVPEAGAAWKPHPRSMALGGLVAHLVNLPSWIAVTLSQTEFDMHPPGEDPARAPGFDSLAAVLERFDHHVAAARQVLADTPDEAMTMPWTLKNGGVSVFTLPRIAVLRSFVLNHMIHHRGQLSVYLRLQDVPLPMIYGPTADSPG